MGRSADYTIQGFLYQFNKTLLEVLTSPDNGVITVEGIIEDIEVAADDVTRAIQCKYHETNEVFTLSAIYEPLLQMMAHFHLNSKGRVNYVLFAHFPHLTEITITREDLGKALASKNGKLEKYVTALKDKVDLDAFLVKFKSEIGPAFGELVSQVYEKMKALGISGADIETLAYPNAIQIIANLSIQHDANLRKITKKELLGRLQKIKSTAISHWTLSLKSRKAILLARRKQLKVNLGTNTRLRYFLFHAESLKDFDSQIVLFIKAYLDKYHCKPAHISTPIFCLNTSEDDFKAIELRLIQKNIALNDGVVAGVFNEALFFRDPIVSKDKREFALRILRWEPNGSLLDKHKADDLFVLGDGGYAGLSTTDVSVEELATDSFDELNYMMGLSDVSE
ncbi:hypothetical protein WT25_17745 [Burkholderia territorii]|uniref:hypothetical protein n=1 Tax=Burkholderia territorii TaxID=1503055 RepID=UPI0007590E01|nr:hypothetical protein [Burkholderia territorii]KVT79551.1 hypothetical protein WT25_17745 [Burkholderia territorii]